MEITIEKALEQDVPEIIKLNYQLFLHDRPYDEKLFLDWPHSEDGKKYFDKAVTNEKYCALLAKTEGQIAGYLIGYIWGHWDSRPVKSAEIDNMFVVQEHRGKGIGKLLIAEFKNWCKAHDVVDLIVMAYKDNTGAIEFYKKSGFEELSTRLHQAI